MEPRPEERLDHVFTHSSWAPDRASSYERLEFLGDSGLELAVARTLYEDYPHVAEVKLAKLRSHIVSRASCAVVAEELALGAWLLETGANAGSRDELERLAGKPQTLGGAPP